MSITLLSILFLKLKGLVKKKAHLVKNIVSGTLEATKDEIKLKLSVDHKNI